MASPSFQGTEFQACGSNCQDERFDPFKSLFAKIVFIKYLSA
jgi:hypothetical protein